MAFTGFSVVFRVGASRLPTTLSFVNGSRTFASVATAKYENLLIEKRGEKQNIGLITMNRPKSLNALCDALIDELVDAFAAMNKDESIGAVVVTGAGKAFAAGADIKEMVGKDLTSNIRNGFLEHFNLYRLKKPVIAAVHGYALGGGCEFAMMCDVIIAGDKTKFGQPEITIGTIPGAGGTQRIARSCGKSKAMEICLTGDHFTSQEAERIGLISRVVPEDKVVEEAVKLAERMARHSPIILQLCKEAVNTAFETTLQEGLRYERSAFYTTFGTEDRKEGMTAFTEKRKPTFKGK